VGDNDILAYDTSSGNWINQTAGEAGLASGTHSHTFASITSTPTTLAGYGITDAVGTSRTITINGTTNRVSVTGGTQSLAANRTWTVDVSSNYAGQATITTVGTIAAGTWQGNPINSSYIGAHNHSAADINAGTLGVARGGVGLATYTAGDVIYAAGTTTLSKLGIGSEGQILAVSSGGIPEWITAGVGVTSLTDLDDVTISSLGDNELLQYDSGSGDWINQTISEIGLVQTSRTLTITGTTNEVTVTGGVQDLSSNRTWTVSLPSGVTVSTLNATIGNITTLNAALGQFTASAGGSSAVETMTSGDTGARVKLLGNGNIVWGQGDDTYDVNLYRAASDTLKTDYSFDVVSDLDVGGNLDVTGTITSATWQGDTVAVAYGGTGFATYTTGDILYASATNTLSKLTAGSEGYVLTISSGVPSWEVFTAGDVPSSRTITINGTSNEITVTGGTQDLSSNRTWTVALPAGTLYPNSHINMPATTNIYWGTGSDTYIGEEATNQMTLVAGSNEFLQASASNTYIKAGGSTGLSLTSSSLTITPDADFTGDVNANSGIVRLSETSTPSADTDYGKIYTKSDNALYFQDGAGVEHEVDLDGAGGGTLDGLTDVVITTPADNEVLAYDSGGNWINQTATEAGLSPVAGSSSIVTVGTVTTGTWSADAISSTKGGTGQTTYASGDILYASATNTLSKLTKGTDGQVLTLASGVPTWDDISSGNLGGLGDVVISTPADNEVLAYDSGGNWINQTAAEAGLAAATHYHAWSDLTSGVPTTLSGYGITDAVSDTELSTWAGTTNITTLGTITSGTWTANTIAETRGGTGLASYLAGDMLYADAANSLATIGIGSNGDILTITTGVPGWSAPSFGTVTEVTVGTGLDVANGTTTPAISLDLSELGLPVSLSSTDFIVVNEAGEGDKKVTFEQVSLSWFNDDLGTPTHSLEDHDDVVITTPADNEVLAYDNGSGNWINQTASEAGLSPLAGSSSIVTVGTVTTGTWSANTIGETKGGTGLSAYTAGDMLYADATNSLATIGIGSNGDILTITTGVPGWSAPSYGTVTEVTVGTGLDVANGTSTPDITLDLNELGSPVSLAATDYLIVHETGEGDKKVTFEQVSLSWFNDDLGAPAHDLADHDDVVISTPADNEVLAYDSGGNWINQTASEAGLSPLAGSSSIVTVGTVTTGTWSADTIGETKGGTGLSSYLAGDMLYADGANSLATIGIGNNGDVLTITTGVPGWAAPGSGGTVTEVTVGTGLDVTNGTTTPNITLDLSELSFPSALASSDYIVVNEIGVGDALVTFEQVDLSWFNNDLSFVTDVTGGTGVDSTGGTTPSISLDLSELTTSTTNGDGDYFVVVDTSNGQWKLTKANIALSGFNNDAGWTSNTGTVTSVTGGTGVDSTGGTTPSLSFDGSELPTGGTLVGTDYLVAVNGGVSNRQLISSIPLSIFNNDLGGGSGTVTSVSAGNGMNFTTITTTGSVTMGTPGTLSASSSNGVSSTSHTHAITATDTGTSSTLVKTTSGGAIRASNDVIAYYSSDIRLKEDIEPLTNALSKIRELNGITFAWNELAGEEKQDLRFHNPREAGLIAQEVLEVLPEAVKSRANGYYGIKYEQIIPLLVEAVKELTLKVEALEA